MPSRSAHGSVRSLGWPENRALPWLKLRVCCVGEADDPRARRDDGGLEPDRRWVIGASGQALGVERRGVGRDNRGLVVHGYREIGTAVGSNPGEGVDARQTLPR